MQIHSINFFLNKKIEKKGSSELCPCNPKSEERLGFKDLETFLVMLTKQEQGLLWCPNLIWCIL